MNKNIKTESRATVCLLFAIFLFSNCQKDKEVQADIDAISATSSESTLIQGVIDFSNSKHDGGYALLIKRAISKTTGDNSERPQESLIRVFEDGVEIGPAHSTHQDIRSEGKGRFSHWGSDLYLSASDNTDPRTNGRTYTYAVISGSAGKPQSPSEVPSNNSGDVLGTNIIGYANVDGKTTGGQGGQTVTVSTLSELRNATESRATLTIKVKGTINGSGSVYVKSNKSIIGIDGGTLNGVGLKIFEVSNVIVQNLTIKYVVAGTEDNDCVNIKYSDHIWIDHCEFFSDRTHGWENWDGLIDITKRSSYITVSWNKLHDSYKALLSGGSAADKDRIKVTIHNNFFYNLAERAPSLIAGNAHVFNNYFMNNNGYCIGSRIDGIVRTDNNYFYNCKTPIDTNLGSDAPGYVSGVSTNYYENSGKNDITTKEINWLPPYEYRSALIAAENVPAVVTQGAGPRL